MSGKHVTYEELGREADLAIRHHATAKQAVIEMRTVDVMAPRIEVRISGATWDNGLLYLQEFISSVVREKLTEIVPVALDRMEQAAGAKTEALRIAFEDRGGQFVDPPRQVPRGAVSTLMQAGMPPFDGAAFAEQTAPTRGDLELRDDFAEYARQKDGGGLSGRSPEALAVSIAQAGRLPEGQGAGTALPSGPEVGFTPAPTTAPVTARVIQPAEYAQPILADGATIKLDLREAELFESIVRKPGIVLARNATLGKLLGLKLIAQDGKGYGLTALGETFASNVAIAGQTP